MAQADRETSIAGIFGVALGLAAVAAISAMIFFSRVRAANPEEVLEESFARSSSLPFDYEPSSAVVLTDGRRVVGFARPSDDAGAELTELDEPETEIATESADVDWSSLPEGEPGTPPGRVFYVHHPLSSGKAALRSAFVREEKERDGRRGGASIQDGTTLKLDGGRLAWGEFGADFLYERRFGRAEGEPAFRDSVLVNLSRSDACWIAHFEWPCGMPGSTERVEEFIAALPPK